MIARLPKKRICLFLTEPGTNQAQFILPERLAKMTNGRNYQQPYSLLKQMMLWSAVFVFVAGAFFYPLPTSAQGLDVSVSTDPLPESNDFATFVLGDPWDMNEFSDISQYLNESGQRNVVSNPLVSNGIFSGKSAGDVLGNPNGAQNGWFFTLFPGYETAIHTGRAGSKTPIDSSLYKCLYIAMYVESPAANSLGPDQYRVFWFGDDRLNSGGAPYGFTTGMPLYPEYGASQPVPVWKLYKVDLPNTPLPPGVSGILPWNGQRYWQGLRIDPTINANVNFKVDWVRLTSCEPQTIPISFTPDSRINAIWLRPQGSTYYIRVATNVNGSSGFHSLDVQGVAPGSYTVALGNQFRWDIAESSETITINQTPILRFENPALYSGQDYATSAGNPWDMNSSADYYNIQCATYGQGDGVLWLNTKPGSQQPSQCKGPVLKEADPKVYLNVPQPFNPAEYRYLSFRFKDTNPWQYVAKGTIMRLVWTVQGDSGRPGYECHLVSQDMPYDVGWNTYTIDLWDAFDGSAETWQGECSSLPKNWRQSSPVLKVRLDPNENITDHSFYQELDWVRLTKPVTISRGSLYRVQMKQILSAEDIQNLTLFYTSDPYNAPTQSLAESVSFNPQNTGGGPYKVYLPLVQSGSSSVPSDPTLVEYFWNTQNVPAGEYYLCAQVTDNLNQTVICSEASVQIVP